MAVIKKYSISEWYKFDHERASCVKQPSFDIHVITKFTPDEEIENYFSEECEIVLEQKVNINDTSYGVFSYNHTFVFDTLLTPENKWVLTDSSYCIQMPQDKKLYEENLYTEEKIKEKINNGLFYESNIWEACNLDKYDNYIAGTRKQYPKWKPFKINYNFVAENSSEDAPIIYIGLVFTNNQYETKQLIFYLPCRGRKRLTEEDLSITDPRTIVRDDDYYEKKVFVRITNTNTKEVIIKYYESICDINTCWKVKPKPSQPPEKKKETPEMFDYIDLGLFK